MQLWEPHDVRDYRLFASGSDGTNGAGCKTLRAKLPRAAVRAIKIASRAADECIRIGEIPDPD